MRDERNANTMNVTGTPTLTTGALTLDTNQALTFNGPTSFYQATDSTSLSITGSMALEFFVKFASLPGATRDIVSKASSYAAQLSTAGKLLFNLNGGGVTVTSNATLTTNTYYHVVCVYNKEYSGAETFGQTTPGGSFMNLNDDNDANKVVCKFTLPEAAILDSVTAELQYFDELGWNVETQAVVYTDSGGVPDDLVTSSDVLTITDSMVDWRSNTTVEFPLTPVVVTAGDYNIGLITDTVAGIPKVVLRTPIDTSGGDLCKRADSVGSPDDPFGTPTVTNDDIMAVYCDYTAIARTGLEGTAAIYINGAFDNSAAYTTALADNANALQISPAGALTVDEVSVWNRVLTPVEIATHYLAR